MSWEKDCPRDVDLHVISVKKPDQSTCRTYFSNKNGCTGVSQDVDNTQGGYNGAETVTLLNNSINEDFTYLIGIEDYRLGPSMRTVSGSGGGNGGNEDYQWDLLDPANCKSSCDFSDHFLILVVIMDYSLTLQHPAI